MTTQTTTPGARTARKRTAAPTRQRAAAQKRQPATRREPESTTEPTLQQDIEGRRGSASAPQQPPPQPVPSRERPAEKEKIASAPGPNGGRGIRLPVIGARIPLSLPRTGRPGLAHVLWLGGLVGAAVLGVVEWPVAAALAAGTWLIERFAKATVREELRHTA
ncbi:hypothetical protein ACNTMW_29890 [Planosporangium sp. 12N6]|uniref:hypothetical protein n=1 Tax=Planosporangium spinosum TaxID=3402278 RepID=UPI003CEB1507